MTTKERNKARLTEVIKMLTSYGISELDVNMLILESGCRYLEARLEPHVAGVYKRAQLFWNWWTNEFIQFASAMHNNGTLVNNGHLLNSMIEIEFFPGKHITTKILQNG